MYVQLFLLYGLVFMHVKDVYANVYWEVKTHPVVFGKSVTLYCNTSSVQDKCDQCTKRWYGGKIEDLLSFNGLAVDHSKYETVEDNDGFSLIIKRFNKEDVNISYSCTFGFYSDKKILQLPSDFEIQPTNDTINITQFINSSSVLNVRVDFKKVHPPPRCTVFLNGDNLTLQLITKDQQEGIFYRVTVDFQYNLIPNHCVHKIQLECVIGTRNEVILSNLTSTCSVENSVKDEKKEIVSVTYVIIEVGILLLLLAAIMAIIIHKRKQKKDKEKDEKLMDLGNEYKEMKMSNEDEQTSHFIVK